MPTLNSHTHCQAAPTKAQTKAWQRVCLPNRTTNTTDKPTDEEEHRSGNSGFAKKQVQWLIEHPTWYQLLFWVDSLLLRNPLLRKAAKRYAKMRCSKNTLQTSWNSDFKEIPSSISIWLYSFLSLISSAPYIKKCPEALNIDPYK